MKDIREYMKSSVVILDGAMGTMLHRKGIRPGEIPERWNVSRPDVITEIHREYYAAGADVVYANTFGANSLKFGPDELRDVIAAGIGCAKKAREEAGGGCDRWVALDIGPCGRMLSPLGDLSFEDAVGIFAETVRLGVEYGADLIVIETMNDMYETKAALLAAKENSDLPVFVTNAYGEDGKLMTGAEPLAVITMLEGFGADAIGVNCSLGPAALRPVVEQYLEYSSLPVILKPNAGMPRVENGETVYDVGPGEFTSEVGTLVRAGVSAAGGCCGTDPSYIRMLSEALRGIRPVPVTEKTYTAVSSYTHAVVIGDRPVIIGERINPTGKKVFRESLKNGERGYILKEGVNQQEKGADILDVNVGVPGIDERKVLTEAVRSLQEVTDLPLQIDTADPSAMESALRIYNGKPLINSVNGKEESMRAVFPLAKKYGGVVIALTLDDGGIPADAAGRVRIAEKIAERAAEYGIGKKDIVFDPLALAVSADESAARETLEAVRILSVEKGYRTSLGISNVSFGLPGRDRLNGAYFTLALGNGLSCAIVNPYSRAVMGAYRAFMALSGKDPKCSSFIDFVSEPEESAPQTPSVIPSVRDGMKPEETGNALTKAIVKGMREEAATLTETILRATGYMEVVNGMIIPALDEVGRGFEDKTVFLPQLLMSAEAAGEAFGVIKKAAAGENGKKDRCRFVIATVRGDIHDIGKNIVRLLLENYGFDVTDLGRDVPPERIAEEVVKLHSPLCGLSALMTTTVPSMAETIKLLRKEAPWCKIVVGGAVLTEEYAREIGADKYARDAMETVRYAEETDSMLKNGGNEA